MYNIHAEDEMLVTFECQAPALPAFSSPVPPTGLWCLHIGTL